MKQYKLIQTYPGSPELGDIYEKIQGICPGGVYMYKNINKPGCCLNAVIIEHNSKYWEEVIKKDYEILSFICNQNYNKLIKGEIIYKQDYNTFEGVSIYDNKTRIVSQVCNEILLTYPHWSIHSVKRLSDGEIFTIGDKVFSVYINYTINKINIVNNKCMINALYDTNDPNGSRLNYNLNNLKKSKKPLFTTEDGVDIFEGDEYYYFRFHSWTFDKARANQEFHSQDKLSSNSLYFSTKEKVEEYILMNKPVLSLKDVENILLNKYNTKFRELVKQKINTNT